MNLIRYCFSKSYRKHRWLKHHLSKLRPYYKAMWPFFKVLKGIELPPRYPSPDPRNIKRVFALTDALYKARKANDGT